MEKTLQIRNVSEATHAKLRARAAEGGHSLSQYVLQLLDKIASQPTLTEALESREDNPIPIAADDIVEAVRSGRDR